MKPTKKQIQKVLRSQNQTDIYYIANKCGVDCKNKFSIYRFVLENAPSKKVEKDAFSIAFGKKQPCYIKAPELPVNNAVNFAKEQNYNSPYCKVLIRGNNNFYWASPVYGHSDYNKSVAFPINEKNERLAYLINSMIYKTKK